MIHLPTSPCPQHIRHSDLQGYTYPPVGCFWVQVRLISYNMVVGRGVEKTFRILRFGRGTGLPRTSNLQ